MDLMKKARQSDSGNLFLITSALRSVFSWFLSATPDMKNEYQFQDHYYLNCCLLLLFKYTENVVRGNCGEHPAMTLNKRKSSLIDYVLDRLISVQIVWSFSNLTKLTNVSLIFTEISAFYFTSSSNKFLIN